MVAAGAAAAGVVVYRRCFDGDSTRLVDEDELVSIEDASAEPGAENPVGSELIIVTMLCQCKFVV